MLKMTRIPSSAARPANQLGGGCAMLFGLPFIIAGIAIGWFLYFPAISGWWSARTWEEVPCWIEKADMTSSRGSKGGTTRKATASYRYEYRGRTYRSEEVGLTGGSDNIGDFQQRAHAQIRMFEGKDRPFRCYVNPAKPEQAVLFPELRWGLMLMMSIFPMVFPLVGALVSLGGALEARKARAEAKLAKQHPSEPWRWRQEWSGETIQESNNGLMAILIAAGWILLVQGPLALGIIVSGELRRSFTAVFALLPAALALIPLFFAWKRIQTRQALGRLSLWLKQTPLRPGVVLEGELRFDRVLSPREVIQVRVLCKRKITRGSGKGSTTTTETIWQHDETLSAGEARRELNGVALPLRVEIPRGLTCVVIEDAEFTTGAVEQHLWSLELTPVSGGKPAVLPLPVFVSREEAKLAEPEARHDVEAVVLGTDELAERLKRCGVLAEFDENGIPVMIDCPPGRFRALGVFLLIFGVIWFGIFIAMLRSGDAPLIFRLIWGTTAPLIIGVGLFTLLHRRRVELKAEEMLIVNGIGPLYSWRETYAPRHIVRFTHDSNMQSGNQHYYRVRAETTFGKTKTLADGFTEATTAETLARRLEEWKKD
jgi:hypothetical protein